MTRAQALLLVVGDPNVLSLDPLWRSFLNYVHANGGWTGLPISWDPDAPVREDGGYDTEYQEMGIADMNDFATRMEAMALGGLRDEDEPVVFDEDAPWREVE